MLVGAAASVNAAYDGPGGKLGLEIVLDRFMALKMSDKPRSCRPNKGGCVSPAGASSHHDYVQRCWLGCLNYHGVGSGCAAIGEHRGKDPGCERCCVISKANRCYLQVQDCSTFQLHT